MRLSVGNCKVNIYYSVCAILLYAHVRIFRQLKTKIFFRNANIAKKSYRAIWWKFGELFFDCRAFSHSVSVNPKESHSRLVVTFPPCNVKIKKDIWLDKSPTAKLARKASQKWNWGCDWLILGKECCSDVSSRFFGGSVAWHPKKRLRRRLPSCGIAKQEQ